MRLQAFPQGLKPSIFLLRIGTAEAVPFQNQVMKQLPEHFHYSCNDGIVVSRPFDYAQGRLRRKNKDAARMGHPDLTCTVKMF